jgi:hypothetical protein
MKSSKSEITLSDLWAFPVWRYDVEADFFEPLTDIDSLIGSIDELHFYATFTSSMGHVFQGSVTGKGDVAAAIFHNNRWYSFNKNWKQASIDQLSALVSDCQPIDVKSPTELLPFKFETAIRRDPYVDWIGEFDLP